VWKNLIRHNPVLLGNITDENHMGITNESVERELVGKMINLYNAESENLTGYSTTGATEGNIFSAWLGREWLKSKKINHNSIRLLQTSLTHYSVQKSTSIVGVKSVVVGLDEKKWNMDSYDLIEKISQFVKKEIKGFMIPMTYGYTLTGTDDNIEKIVSSLRGLKEKYKDIEFYCWIDGAMSGLIKPFTEKIFSPFKYPEIKTFAVDFHKFGHTPCPSGLILHRKELLSLIARPIDFLKRDDNTLLSTRTAIPAAASLLTIESFGKKGFRDKIKRNLKAKEVFLSKYGGIEGIEFITSKNNLTVGMIMDINDRKNVEYFRNKYNMYFKELELHFTTGIKKFLATKVYFINF